MKFDVVIIGGGIIGATCAFELGKSGKKVAIIEKNNVGYGASSTSAAMLEFQTDSYRGEPFTSLAQKSIRLFPALHEEVKKITGIDFQYEQCGILQLALSQEEAIMLENEVTRQTYHGLKAKWISKEQLQEQYPILTDDHFGAALFKEDGQVNGEKFLAAMIKAAQFECTQIFENTFITAIQKDRDKITSLQTKNDTFEADHFVLAAGAWSDEILNLIDLKIGIEPVRGQLLVMDTPQRVLDRPVYTKSGGYITPKNDGYTFVGSTVERVGFDNKTTSDAKDKLHAQVAHLAPFISQKPVRGMTAGLRPGSPDILPFIGPLDHVPNFIMATGHYRNGILLSPGTAQIVTQIIHNKPIPTPISHFSPHRFNATVAQNARF